MTPTCIIAELNLSVKTEQSNPYLVPWVTWAGGMATAFHFPGSGLEIIDWVNRTRGCPYQLVYKPTQAVAAVLEVSRKTYSELTQPVFCAVTGNASAIPLALLSGELWICELPRTI
jgi:hypothetical protein